MIIQLLKGLVVEVARLVVGPVGRRATRELFLSLLVSFVALLVLELVWHDSVEPFINLVALFAATAIVGLVAVALDARARGTSESQDARTLPLSWAFFVPAPAISAVLVWSVVRGLSTRPYIWAIVAGATTFLIVYITERQQAKRTAQDAPRENDLALGPQASLQEGPIGEARWSSLGNPTVADGVVGRGSHPATLSSTPWSQVSWTKSVRQPHTLAMLLRVGVVLVPMAGALIYGTLNIYSKPIPIGDGLTIATEMRQIAESGRLPQYFTYLVINSDQESRAHRAIDYPTTFHVIGAFFWMLGGEKAVFLLTALSAAGTVLFGYLIFRRVHPLIAGLVGAAVLLAPFGRFTQVVFVEPALLAVMLAAIYFYGRFLDVSSELKWKYALLTGVLLGLGIALKQQGWILAAALAPHGFAWYILTRKSSNPLRFKLLLLMAAVAVGTMFLPVADLTARTGSVLGKEFSFAHWLPPSFPFVHGNVVIDPEAQEWLLRIRSYTNVYASHWQVVKEFLLYPMNYRISGLGMAAVLWIPLSLVLLGSALFHSVLKRRAIWIAIIMALAVEVLVTKQTNDFIFQYHQLGIAVVPLVEILGGIAVFGWLSRGRLRNVYPVVAGVLVAFGFMSLVMWTQANHVRAWGDANRWENKSAVAEYEDLSAFVASHVPEDALVYASGAMFQHFARREVIVTTWWGGAKLPFVWTATSGDEAVKNLEPYGVDYVLVDAFQFTRVRTPDYIPPQGFVQSLDSSPNFKLVYRSPAGSLSLYKVVYAPG